MALGWLQKVLAAWVALVRASLPIRIEMELGKLARSVKAGAA